jgi:hypothetical protein
MSLKIVIFGTFVIYLVRALENPSLKKSDGAGKSDEIVHLETDYDATSSNSNFQRVEITLNAKNYSPKKHVLMYHPWGTPSHMHQFKPLILGLLEAGNAVTAVFVRETKIIHPDYAEIIVEDGKVALFYIYEFMFSLFICLMMSSFSIN